MRRWAYPLALLAICGALYFWRLGITPLDDFDEAYYAEGAREMLERGDLGTPYFNGQPFLLKPVLIYWLIAGAFRLFGVTEFAARSFSAFFATAIVILTYWFGSKALSPRAGFLAGLSLALCYMWVDNGREAMIDMPLTAALAPALFLVFMGTEAAPDRKWRLYLPAYPLIGIALLAKGPAGTIPSLVGLLLYLVFSRRLARTVREAYVLPGIALALVVAAPWYVYEGIRQPDFLATFLLREHFGHLQGELARDDAWWGHIKNVIVGFYPWVAFLPAALVGAFRGSGQAGGVLRFCAWWAGAVIVSFSFAGAKLPHYLVPAFPPMALLVAGWYDRWVRREDRAAGAAAVGFGLLGVVGLALAALAGVAALMPAVVRERIATQFGPWTPGAAPVVMLTALAAGSLGAVATFVVGRPSAAGGAPPAAGGRATVFPLLASAMLAALTAHVGWFKPRLSLIQSQPRKELAQLAGAMLPADEPLGVFYAKRNATIFYARRPIVDLGEWEPEKLVAFLSSPSPATALTHARFLSLVEREAPRAQLWTRRGDFVLVSNHPAPLFHGARERSVNRPTSGSRGP
ncbi:MAG: ArnT family glycosyltransferase [Armatimonadota bacterium]